MATVYTYPLKPVNSFALEQEAVAAGVPVVSYGVSVDEDSVNIACKRDLTDPEKASLDTVVANHVPPPPPVGGGQYARAHADAGGAKGELVPVLPAGSVQIGLTGTFIIRGPVSDFGGGLIPLTPLGDEADLNGGWRIAVAADGAVNLKRMIAGDAMDAQLSLLWL